MSQATQRDRVPRAQEKVVIARSGDKCAYPGCGIALTIESQSSGDQPKATGKVAHIAAASPGGPRYDATMTSAQRGSAENLIYLCGPHHDAVDFQLEHHSRQFLLEAKRSHEETVSRAVRSALGEVTYEELMVVCTVLASTDPEPPSKINPALPVQEKIELNRLGPSSIQRIKDGLSQASRVADFLAWQSASSPSFGKKLVAQFKSDYYAALADGLDPDAVFDYLVENAFENAGPRDTPQIRAAALAVIAYLFEICEIFEHE